MVRVMGKLEDIQSKLKQLSQEEIDKLSDKDLVYRQVNKLILTDENGNRLPLDKKFAFFGVTREPIKKKGAFERIKQALDEFMQDHKSIEELKTSDEAYIMVKNANIKVRDENGVKRRLTAAEIFKRAGYPREELRTSNIVGKLVDLIEDYKKTGKDFHQPREEMPFFTAVKDYAKYRGKEPEQVMHELGYKEYNDIFYRFGDLEKIKKFADYEGFVDSYRNDKDYSNYIKSVCKNYIPAPILLELMFDAPLKKFSLQDDYLAATKQGVEEYIEKHGSLKGVSNNEKLFYQLEHIKDTIGKDATYLDVLDILDIAPTENNFATSREHDYAREKELLNKIMEKAVENNREIPRNVLDNDEYYFLVQESRNHDTTIGAYLNTMGIKYLDGRNIPRLARRRFTEIPQLEEMKEERDRLIKNSGISKEKGNCKEEIFENRLKVVTEVYKKFYKEAIADQGKFNDPFLQETPYRRIIKIQDENTKG